MNEFIQGFEMRLRERRQYIITADELYATRCYYDIQALKVKRDHQIQAEWTIFIHASLNLQSPPIHTEHFPNIAHKRKPSDLRVTNLHDAAQSPHVRLPAMALFVQHFRGQVIGCTADRFASVADWLQLGSQPKVTHFQLHWVTHKQVAFEWWKGRILTIYALMEC